jgi:alkylation response protein AidB-like acyl-CoA dehydrogenase
MSTLIDDREVAQRAIAELLQSTPPAAHTDVEFLRAVYDAGLAWIHFPVGRGGLGLNPALHHEVYKGLIDAGAPDYISSTPIGYGMAAPTILEHGSPAQIERHLRPLFTGEEQWCQLFSEPGAGSDLAALATRAVRDGGSWIVNGQKVWTTLGHAARFGLLVARTDPNALKHAGLTYFLLDMTSPGVEVRPLRQMSGDAEFNEVYLTDVRVPDADRIGEVGAGWSVAMTTLANERLVLGATTPRHGGAIAHAVEIWHSRAEHPAEAAVLHDRLLQLWVRDDVAWLLAHRGNHTENGASPGPEGSLVKIVLAKNNQDTYDLCLDILGADGLLYDGPPGEGAGDTAEQKYLFLRARAQSIEGGTSEILRDVIAHRILGLPASHRPDKGVPWKDIPRG